MAGGFPDKGPVYAATSGNRRPTVSFFSQAGCSVACTAPAIPRSARQASRTSAPIVPGDNSVAGARALTQELATERIGDVDIESGAGRCHEDRREPARLRQRIPALRPEDQQRGGPA